MKITMVIAALLAAVTVQAQQITNAGYGVAGKGPDATTQAYDIKVDATGKYIIYNGIWYAIAITAQQDPSLCNVVKWDQWQKKTVPYGVVTIKPVNGVTVGGLVQVRAKSTRDGERGPLVTTYKLDSFAVVGYKGTLPNTVIKENITVLVYDPHVGIFLDRPDLFIRDWRVTGTMWLNPDLSLHSAIFDTFSENGISQLNIIPAPGGPGSATLPGVYPTKMR